MSAQNLWHMPTSMSTRHNEGFTVVLQLHVYTAWPYTVRSFQQLFYTCMSAQQVHTPQRHVDHVELQAENRQHSHFLTAGSRSESSIASI